MRQRLPYEVVVADPAWPFGDKLPGGGRGAAKHYRTMTIQQIRDFPLPPVADDALLLLRRVAAMQEEALSAMRAWGFAPKSELVWVKAQHEGPLYTHAVGMSCREACADAFAAGRRLAMGMGRYVRHSHEVCLIGVRGRAVRLIRSHSERSVFFAPRQEHSRRPDEFYDVVERLHAGPYVELFARREREGWECQGNEMPVRSRGRRKAG